ncbi:protein indeterminate-domain 11-like [Vigna unguiculata]|uniref:protein indeterminate-domain 11-like n=1 Tax=Vigna unguiculata TaxID=3917 RepID=UPI001015FAF3|nr:protein indeterminate-domain 11-like [Vigna unguiculata]
MEMKGFVFNQQHQQQQQQQQVVEENMSNLTSASGEASASSGNRTEIGTSYPQQYLPPPPTTQTQQPPKKKRNLPGNPDPDAEVIALSPKSLLATNRFICEICNKGFQRDQNLQLHRRGHNLPWKLKQRTSKEVRKKVYVCPEANCVHHDPSRALGDLTGIKKHFCRKHGEKKWKCDKCSKKYAVQSDWKAHSKTCGTREYRCDCGTLFSRRDSFITHRAFCDALAEESARAITGTANNNQLLPPQPSSSSSHHHHQHHHHTNNNNMTLQTQFNPQNLHAFSLKKEQQSFNLRPEMPPWLGPPSEMFSPSPHQENPNPSLGPTLAAYQTVPNPSPHMSATALLQKAAQMGATMSRSGSSPAMARAHHQVHMTSSPDSATAHFGFNLSSRDQHNTTTTTSTTPTTVTTNTATVFSHGFLSSSSSPLGNKAAAATVSSAPSLLHDVINSFSSPSAFQGTPFEDAFGGIQSSKKLDDDDSLYLHDTFSKTSGAAGNEGLTRDFLGLRPLSHNDILTIAGIGNCIHDQQNQSQKPWQG